MKRVIDLSANDARKHFLRQSSYLKEELPDYISFAPMLNGVAKILDGAQSVTQFGDNPKALAGVNFELVANKDGRFDWRPFELMHPAIYVALINLVCDEKNWKIIQKRVKQFEGGAVDCCSWPVISTYPKKKTKDGANQVRSWWQRVEQKSIEHSLEFSHSIHTDVSNCYGSLYTHSISWALHGFQEAKDDKGEKLLGGKIDQLIRSSRHGQTNGIPQGPQIMDVIAEIVLGYVDLRITNALGALPDFKILRYRDDYRIFANSDSHAEAILKVVADELRHVGMRLGSAKTQMSTNVVESSVKREKLAAINLQDLGETQADTVQKQLLRIHSYCRQYPHSGQLRRLLTDFHKKLSQIKKAPRDIKVQVAITADIGFLSPSSFPAVAAILSHLIALTVDEAKKKALWESVRKKMKGVPKNGYLDIWLQRVIQAQGSNLEFNSDEPICKIVNGENVKLWENSWIKSKPLKAAIDVKKAIVGKVKEKTSTVPPEEIALFAEQAENY